MAKFHIHPWAKVGSLKNATVMDLTAELSNMKIENDLRREVQDNIRRLKDMGTYRGRRHAMGLPVRGQRTRTQVTGTIPLSYAGMLTIEDHHRTEAEQDRARRPGTRSAVEGAFAYTMYHIVQTRMERRLQNNYNSGSLSLGTHWLCLARALSFIRLRSYSSLA